MDYVKKNKLIVNGLYVLSILLALFVFAEMLTCNEMPDVIKSTVLVLFGIIIIAVSLIYLQYRRLAASKASELIDAKSELKNKDSKGAAKEKKDKSNEIKSDTNEDNFVKFDISTIIPSGKGITSLEEYSNKLLSNIAKQLELVTGVVYVKNEKDQRFESAGTYAYYTLEEPPVFSLGEGLPGQVAKDQKAIYLTNVPDKYMNALSGLGEGQPCYLLFIPLVVKNITIGVLELASFKPLNIDFNSITENLSEKIFDQVKGFMK